MNVLWLTKSALVETTAKEANKWGMMFIPVQGTSPEKLANMRLFASLPTSFHVVTNYETMNNKECLDFLMATPFKVIVIDEVHRLKGGANPIPTLIWKNCNKFIQHQRETNQCYPMFLSGSILNNKPEELWAYLHPFNPEQFPRLRDFQALFNNQVLIEGLGWTPQELLKMLAPSMIRRRKDEVAAELPDKTILEPITLKLDPKSDLYRIHRMLADDLLQTMDAVPDDKEISTTSVLAKLTYLRAVLLAPGHLKWNYYPVNPDTGERAEVPEVRHLNFDPPYTKLESLIEQIDDLNFEGERSVVFSTFNAPLEYLHKFYGSLGIRSAVLKGGSDYAELQRKFQQAEIDILLIQLKSGAEGLNLHRSNEWPGGASQVVFADRWWNPELNRQGEDRCYRIGAQKPVFVRKTYVKGTVDYLIRDIEEEKALVNAGITESSVFRAGTWRERLHEYLG